MNEQSKQHRAERGKVSEVRQAVANIIAAHSDDTQQKLQSDQQARQDGFAAQINRKNSFRIRGFGLSIFRSWTNWIDLESSPIGVIVRRSICVTVAIICAFAIYNQTTPLVVLLLQLLAAAGLSVMDRAGGKGQKWRPIFVSMTSQALLLYSSMFALLYLDLGVLRTAILTYTDLPSISTILCTFLMGIADMCYVFNTDKRLFRIHTCAMIIGAFNTVSLTAYIFDAPYFIDSGWMAHPASSLNFILLAFGLHEVSYEWRKNSLLKSLYYKEFIRQI